MYVVNVVSGKSKQKHKGEHLSETERRGSHNAVPRVARYCVSDR